MVQIVLKFYLETNVTLPRYLSPNMVIDLKNSPIIFVDVERLFSLLYKTIITDCSIC